MVTNNTGYELHVGPDKTGRYLTVQPGDEYEPPEPADQLQDPRPDHDQGDEEPELNPPNPDAATTGGAKPVTASPEPTGKPATETTTTPPPSSGTNPASRTAEPTGDDQKAETTP